MPPRPSPPSHPSVLPPSSPSSVLVAVRVRPFNQREKERQAQLIVRMRKGKVTELRDPSGRESPRLFTFDHSYWSHDGFQVAPDGFLFPDGSTDYADQKRVFDDLGVQILRNAWTGYNCTLFAYGQTGSGKSYSVVGIGNNRGLVPMVCQELFRSIEGERARCRGTEWDFQVTLAMLEIYCEKVRDLLRTETAFRGGLKVREHPKRGIFVEGMSNWPVQSYREVEKLMAKGTRARTIAATNMNETSSRAHTIVRLGFTQKSRNSEKRVEINLVDLAGSERLKQSGSEGPMFREGIRINQSLSTLGRVIKALHERQSGKQVGQQIPYRDSVLTSLLRNALGGNSKTIMLATISPSHIHYEETLSTLRFADRVKAIKTVPIVNESATERRVKAMREENARLLETLSRGGLEGAASSEELEALRRQLADNQREMEKLGRSWHQREEALRKQLSSMSVEDLEQSLEVRRKDTPHLWNLNEDPALSDVIVHFVDKGDVKVGSGAKVQIQLKGLGIQPEHALLRNKDNRRITLSPLNGAEILVNGRRVEAEVELKQNDRIHFGGNHLFVFANPKEPQQQRGKNQSTGLISYEMAQREMATNALKGVGGKGNKSKEEELVLEEQLVGLLPYVYRANSMAREMGSGVLYEIVLLPPGARGLAGGPTEVWVKVRSRGDQSTLLWDTSRFMNRYHRMQEQYQNLMEEGEGQTGEVWSADGMQQNRESNPPNTFPAGTTAVFLQNLANLVGLTEEKMPILDEQGQEVGKLVLSVTPCTVRGRPLVVAQSVENGGQLQGRNLVIKVNLHSALGLSERWDRSWCQYQFFDREMTRTSPQSGPNPVYSHERLFTFCPVTRELVDYLEEGALIITVFASTQCLPRTRQSSSIPQHLQQQTVANTISRGQRPMGRGKGGTAGERGRARDASDNGSRRRQRETGQRAGDRGRTSSGREADGGEGVTEGRGGRQHQHHHPNGKG